MKKAFALLIAALILLSALAGCANKPASTAVADGRDRPSTCGKLKVEGGKLCSESGEPVMLRGVSSHELISSESFINGELFSELSRDVGVNVFRLAVYTYGVGVIGYCTKGDKERYKEDVVKGVEYAKENDMYAIVDWHVLSDGDPNTHIEEAKLFFAEMAEKFRDHNNVLYEICNEPNGIEWSSVKSYAETVIPIIREKDPDSVIIVGNPNWSKDLDNVQKDPLEYENVMYTFHFYAASHGDDARDMVRRAIQNGLPVFVTEFGVTADSGGYPRDLESADEWIELLESGNISYCMWSFTNFNEACSAIRFTVLKHSGFEREDYSETGLWLIDTLARRGGSEK